MAPKRTSKPSYLIERAAGVASALAIVGTLLVLLIRNEPMADSRLFFALRVVISVAAAVLGATIPGFLQIRWTRGGFAVRAGGALALFVLTFVYTPDLATSPQTPPAPITQTSSGNNSPPIANNSGIVTIQNSPAPPPVKP